MLPATQNVGKEQREDAISSKDDLANENVERQAEGCGGMIAADASPHGPLTAETSENDTSGSTTIQISKGLADADSCQQAPAKGEASFHDRLETDTQVSTTSEGDLTSMSGMSDIKKKIPGLPDLILPSTPASPCNEREMDSVTSSDGDINEKCSPTIQPLLRRISISGHGRLKTRLQDPPLLTPAVQNQLTHCSSSLLHRRASLLAGSEQQNARPDDLSGAKTPSESNQTNATNPISNPSGSFNNNFSSAPPAVTEEECDPLDDDVSLASKKKKLQESKWDIYLQWIILLLLIAFLACLIKIKFLNRAKFLGLDLWRWVALTFVVFCGRLMSGWIVKVAVVSSSSSHFATNV